MNAAYFAYAGGKENSSVPFGLVKGSVLVLLPLTP